MRSPAHAHPTDSALGDFVLGKLSGPDDAEIASHLSECAHCQARAAATHPADTFLSLIAAAGTRADSGQTIIPTLAAEVAPADGARTRVGDAEAATEPSGPDADDEIPEGLAHHPRYRLVRLLGRGGMGVVWLAEHKVMGRRVALKVINPAFLAREGAVERFRREVRAAAQLNHPNIVTAYDADAAGGAHFLVVEYVPGESLLEVVKRGPLPVAEACRAVRDAARGLAHAHETGLVHRDVKPGNLIRAADGTVKVLDFGLVGIEAEIGGLTGENVVMGTPDYIAPEQANDARSADARSDVYSLGCTLYHLLAGRVPFPADSALKKLDAHRDAARPPEPVPAIPAKLAVVLTRMMAKNPAARYQTADAVTDALDHFCIARAEPPAEAPRDSEPTNPKLYRRFTIAAGALITLAAVVGAGAVYKIQRDKEVITVETDDPDIEVVMKRNGELVRIVDAKTKQAWELDAQKMRLKPDGGELSIDVPGKEPLVLRRNGAVAVSIRRVPVAPPVALPDPVTPVPPAAARDRQSVLAVTDYREIHGAELAGLRRWLKELPTGFRPVDLTARAGADPPRFDAVAIRDGHTFAFEAHLDLDRSGPEHLKDYEAMNSKWTLRISCPYDDGKGRPRHHIWVKDGAGWFANGFALGAVSERVQRWGLDGARPKKLYLNASDPGKGRPERPMAALLESGELLWELFPELTAPQLAAKLTETRTRGWRPDALGDMGAGPDRTYALTIIPNPTGLAWEFRAGLTVAQYEAALTEQKALGRRPMTVTSEGTGATVRYAAIWIEYAPQK